MPTEFIEKDERGQVRERYFEDEEGRLEGVATHYDDEGRLVQESHWRAGTLHGPMSLYDPDGQVVQRVMFVDGQLHGPAELQDEQGHVRMLFGFQEGRLHGELLAWQDGQPLVKHSLAEGRHVGPLELYEEGRLTRRVLFEAVAQKSSMDLPMEEEPRAREPLPTWLHGWLRGGSGT
ncbi:hypothetical protein F0U59_17295 [Archangium gephyra]|nr:hypothetical protein F0U59_17295 [Archangium gephyra]